MRSSPNLGSIQFTEKKVLKLWRSSIIALSSIFLITSSLCSIAPLETVCVSEAPTQVFPRVILFSWDGVQYNHLIELYNSDKLPNLKNMMNETSLPILKALITDHYTETNYGHPSMLSGMGQGDVEGCPDNITVWENIEAWNSSWMTGSIAGKAKFSNQIFPLAKDDVDYWYAGDVAANIVTDLAMEFIQNYSNCGFFLFVHYREPDSAGHTYGENSLNYEIAIRACDNQIGTILSALETEGIRDSTAILVTTDHGFIESGTMHSSPAWGAPSSDPNCYVTWLACSEGTVNLSEAENEYWDQNDVAPTIYSLIGFNDYASRWPYIRGKAIWDRSFDLRDVAIIIVQLSVNVTTKETIFIDVFVENQGNYTEIPTVSVYCNNYTIGIKTLVYPDIPLFGFGHNSSTRKITFAWDTSTISPGLYAVSAKTSVIPAGDSWPNLVFSKNETDIADNTLSAGVVLVRVPCDVTGPTLGMPDWVCNMRDIGYFCSKFGTTPSSPNWDPNCDVTGPEDGVPDNTVNMRDIDEACSQFLKQDS